MSTRNSQRGKGTEKPEPEKQSVVLVNRTGQKQIISLNENETYELTAYGTRKVELTKEEAEHKFKLWINKNIITIQ